MSVARTLPMTTSDSDSSLTMRIMSRVPSTHTGGLSFTSSIVIGRMAEIKLQTNFFYMYSGEEAL